MRKAVSPKLNRQILEEASEWFVDFRVGDVDAAATERFDEWLRRSPEHIRAYWEIAKTYVELPPASYKGKLKVDELIAYAKADATANVVALHPTLWPMEPPPPEMMRVESETERATRPLLRRRFLVTAALAFALTIAGAASWLGQRYPLYATDVGERRSITLADGSAVDLNARSKLRIKFSSTERRVELLEGQALFQVAKDKHRPFLVQSGDALVRAVGTQFDVYRKDSGTTVTVLEGRVAVYSTTLREPASLQSNTGSNAAVNASSRQPLPRASARESFFNSPFAQGRSGAGAELSGPPLADPSRVAAIFLSAGEQVTVTPDVIATTAPQHADLTAATAWLQRKLIFEGSKLSDVAAEFNRYNAFQLVIEDPQLRDFQISGVYSSTDPSSFLRFLKDQGVKVTQRGHEIRIDAQ